MGLCVKWCITRNTLADQVQLSRFSVIGYMLSYKFDNKMYIFIYSYSAVSGAPE